ncbi:von Willebrand factor A domain-containing protein 7-like isoform X2 [Dreissena polymorpha]|nr:von Willebrand factor A domain-containing protein 7-like isoform X2 [Dreissena polymorpha]
MFKHFKTIKMARIWLSLLVLGCFQRDTLCFLPNPFSAIDTNDYTHTDITEIGVLKAVAKFFEENAVQACRNCSNGALTGLPDITARRLYDQYYGGQVSEKRFQEAIDDLVKHNNKVDQDHYSEAAWHFNGEQIKESNAKMQTLRDTLLNTLNSSNPNFDAARELIGQYLHLLQMFYSNTNWVEMSGGQTAVIYQPLGISGLPIMAAAPPSIDTCRSCGGTYSSDCQNNLIVAGNLLTSGYKSGQDVVKPAKNPGSVAEGKCSHGGPRDSSATSSAAVGGINKDSMDTTYSPHHHLHEKAAELAIDHTRLFFEDPTYGLRKLVGDDKFQDLLQIRSGNSLVFVIDTTGSMGKDIAAVQNKTAEIVSETKGTPNAPYNYILVTFNDPGNETTVQKTTNPDDIQRWLAAIQVHGGDDCPEFSLTGIQAASTVAMPNSNVFVFTDATPKDPQKINYITSLITEKKLRVQFLVTGSCTRKR